MVFWCYINWGSNFFCIFCTSQHILLLKGWYLMFQVPPLFLFCLYVQFLVSIVSLHSSAHCMHHSDHWLWFLIFLRINASNQSRSIFGMTLCSKWVMQMQNVSIPCLLWQFIFASEVNLCNNVGIFTMTRFSVTLWRSGALKKMVHYLCSVDKIWVCNKAFSFSGLVTVFKYNRKNLLWLMFSHVCV